MKTKLFKTTYVQLIALGLMTFSLNACLSDSSEVELTEEEKLQAKVWTLPTPTIGNSWSYEVNEDDNKIITVTKTTVAANLVQNGQTIAQDSVNLKIHSGAEYFEEKKTVDSIVVVGNSLESYLQSSYMTVQKELEATISYYTPGSTEGLESSILESTSCTPLTTIPDSIQIGDTWTESTECTLTKTLSNGSTDSSYTESWNVEAMAGIDITLDSNELKTLLISKVSTEDSLLTEKIYYAEEVQNIVLVEKAQGDSVISNTILVETNVVDGL